MTPKQILEIEGRIVQALRGVYDPEIPVNVYDLGLIYAVEAAPEGSDGRVVAHVRMTLTAPNCPMADMLLEQVRTEVGRVEGVERAEVELTFDPPWDKNMLSDEAKLELGLL